MARYTVLIDGEAGAYGVVVPDLPGCSAMGETIEEALANAGEAMRDWTEVSEARGNAVPAPRAVEDLRRDADVREALAEGATLASVPLIRESGRPAKANLSIDAGILAAIDEEAARQKLTRSAFIEWMAKRMLANAA
ncbi:MULTISPECIES: type II toxin-antitoxin system HicB family antitoxin [unclassified Chelatococcus]|uniref:type II toxin-antitoxin system HicB family antitoxin n=1 Tax=unclassified Chelatococcus TaxID=2638111 RepID=UPI001BD0E1A2|nr:MULTISPECIES: type II toxin-antitoxin system HicB family antitoxin [unclassified Chelatococcus]MBS7698755.1 type II toxin-antitoxin system HicB family antitoxin [Chelatococcus sp. YT9]MBX3543596.1 type II toxin-antitoxin system HicB family antitoxin [Chelatococcus sp.]MBX3554663.1 type II toxin-antitoxin system HicB family antitoxin [Chelatococcus sp.]